jgi:hypothetical protein
VVDQLDLSHHEYLIATSGAIASGMSSLDLAELWRRKTRRACDYSNRSACESFSDVTGQRELEAHALKRFHHQHNPQHKTQETEDVQEQRTKAGDAPTAQSTEPPPHPKYSAQHGPQDVQAQKHDYRLRRMESDIRTLVDEKKNQAGNPAKDVAQECRQIFR